jgi:glycosyltransferase involved in cell wall biosynthesis
VLETIADGTTVIVDGLAFGAMPVEIERAGSRLRIVGLIHLPLSGEVGLEPDVAIRLKTSEQRSIAASSLVIVTGKATRAFLESDGVPGTRIAVVEPGTARAPLARGSGAGPLHLLCVATLNQGKGHDMLFGALAAVSHLDWRLTCAGSLDRDPPMVQRLCEQLQARELVSRVALVGGLDEAALAECYDKADLFVLATRHETYCMAVAEALAHGLPVVSTMTGAIPELVGDSAGVVVPVGDLPAFTAALEQVMSDSTLRASLADGARRVRKQLPTWNDAVDNMVRVLETVAVDV